MRVTLLPRETAARVLTGAVSMLAYSAGLAIVILAVPLVIDALVHVGAPEALPVPLAMLAVILVGIVVALIWSRPLVVLWYLVVSVAASVVYQLALIDAAPQLFTEVHFVLNRPTLAVAAVGVAATSVLLGVAWSLFGFAAATSVSIFVALIADVPVKPGWGPTMVLAIGLTLQLTLYAIQVRQRRRNPRFDELESLTRRRAASADLARRTTAVVHDTVLNDLAVVMNAPDALDARARTRLLDDLETLQSGGWVSASQTIVVPNESQARIRNELARVASDFRWRGLNVNVTGVTTGVYVFDPNAGDALVLAVRAALENVLKHSGTDTANVELVYSTEEVVFLISDQGVGFDPATIDGDRLGVRDSIVGRIEAVGGRAQIWSSSGNGTTVLIAIPVTEVLDPGRPSDHQRGDFGD